MVRLLNFLFLNLVLLNLSLKAQENTLNQEDLLRISNITNELYTLSQKQIKPDEISRIYTFIWEHRKVQIKPLLERVKVGVDGFSGLRNRPYETNAPNDLKPYTYVGGTLSFSLLDEKERRQKQQEIIKQKNEIIAMVESFIKAKHDLKILNLKLEIENLKERRLKARVIQGVENLDERIKKFDEILELKEQISANSIKSEKLKLQLLELIEPQFERLLEQML